MSRTRKNKKKHPTVVRCAECGKPADRTPAGLLSNAAAALAALEDAGISVKLRHDAVITPEGYVLPLRGSKDGRWVARTNSYTPFTPPPPAADDLDD